ncbi:MAG: DUF72 domain-containing protein [Verrucomicrobia bacterium]|nr:DUF72 domain-containing protein [Verrucomicrobiota bacterium]
MRGRAYIGTSGWNYKSWRKDFYGDTPQRQWLRFCAERFTSIEINGTFYRLQNKSTFNQWREQTPEKFPFAIKGHRYVTHNKKLLDVEESVMRCRESASPLGERLAVVVWQLPAFLKENMDRLEKFLDTLRHWKSTRHAIEFRHKSWFNDKVAECLNRHAMAVCMSDAPDWPMWEEVTTDLVYVRLHGHTRKYASSYNKPSLRKWATRIGDWLDQNRDVHVYFDNDAEGAAPRNALRLLEMLR